MKKFLFITTLTPKNLLSPLRASLFDLFLEGLGKQSYPGWEALLIGEEEKAEEKIRYLKTDAVVKSDKLKIAFNYIQNLEVKPDFIIRLDDDDLISPNVLERVSLMEFDCYADQYHTFYDLASGKISQQKRNWLANTVIHKYEHAISTNTENQLPLFMQDHSQAWHVYYENMKVIFSDPSAPVYLRILSPTTITSKMDHQKRSAFENTDMLAYSKYVKKFGNWKNFKTAEFSTYHDKLISIWEKFSNQKIKTSTSFLSNLFNKT
jgi:hypothetical protein